MNKPRKALIDLSAYMAECEANYRRILRLVDLQKNQVCYDLAGNNEQSSLVSFTIVERCKYTTILSLHIGAGTEWLTEILFDIRLYHDAKMAEVFSFQNQGRVFANYNYPNAKMVQKDEKIQQHRFLTECLNYCLKNGLARNELLLS